jgi:hypothetical protein
MPSVPPLLLSVILYVSRLYALTLQSNVRNLSNNVAPECILPFGFASTNLRDIEE